MERRVLLSQGDVENADPGEDDCESPMEVTGHSSGEITPWGGNRGRGIAIGRVEFKKGVQDYYVEGLFYKKNNDKQLIFPGGREKEAMCDRVHETIIALMFYSTRGLGKMGNFLRLLIKDRTAITVL